MSRVGDISRVRLIPVVVRRDTLKQAIHCRPLRFFRNPDPIADTDLDIFPGFHIHPVFAIPVVP